MDKTLQEMQIEVAQYWSGVEEMKDCEWSLVEIEGPGLQIVNAEWFFASNLHSPTTKRKYYGPYIKIEDGNPWSSAAILARCGWGCVQSPNGWKMWHKASDQTENLCWYESCGQEYQELANNLALQWLHYNAHDVWLKGMELCN